MIKRNRFIKIVCIALFLIGAALILYPFAATKINYYRDKRLAGKYSSRLLDISENEKEKIIHAAEAYNENLRFECGNNILINEKQFVHDSEYEKLLSFSGDGIIGILEIPSINVEIPIYHYSDENVLKKGAGHIHGSSLPIGGNNTHTIISAHSGMPTRKLFDDIDKLVNGDLIYVSVAGNTLVYRVFDSKTVLPSETESLRIEDGKDLLTLISCTPYGINTHRILVTAIRCENEENFKKNNADKESENMKKKYIFFIIVMIFTLFGFAGAKKLADTKNDTKTSYYMEDFDGKNLSLTLELTIGENMAVKGAEIEIFRIADISVKNGISEYSFTEDVLKLIPELKSKKTEEQDLEKISKFLDAQELKADYISVSNEEGKAVFTDIPAGLYYIKQVGKSDTAIQYENIKSFIVNVPSPDYDHGKNTETGVVHCGWINDVVAYPKMEIQKKASASAEMPVTSDDSGILFHVSAMIISLFTFGILFKHRRREK